MCMLLWWAGRKLARPFTQSPQRQPIRFAMLVFAASILASYVVGNLRPIVGPEARSADRGLLTLCAWLGLVLVANDHISTRLRLDMLLRRLVLLGSFVAALGLVQFNTGRIYTNYLKLPGLVQNSDIVGVSVREGFARPSSTAVSPIEFGVAMCMLLPFTLHYALNHRSGSKWRRFAPLALLAVAIPISVSRSALICAIVGLLLMLPAMTVRARFGTLLGVGATLGIVFVTVPGMLGALTNLFTGISDDGSAASRTGSYTLAFEFISRAPVFGRGFFTFMPEYRILDNQYLGSLIELGVVGLFAFLALLATGAVLAQKAKGLSSDPGTRLLAQALFASLAAGAAGFAFFDGFGFPMVGQLIFLILGCIGALYRIVRATASGDDNVDEAFDG